MSSTLNKNFTLKEVNTSITSKIEEIVFNKNYKQKRNRRRYETPQKQT